MQHTAHICYKNYFFKTKIQSVILFNIIVRHLTMYFITLSINMHNLHRLSQNIFIYIYSFLCAILKTES